MPTLLALALLVPLPVVASASALVLLQVGGTSDSPAAAASSRSAGCSRRAVCPRGTASGASCYLCADLHAALSTAETLQNRDVVVSFSGAQRGGPYAVRAPEPGSGTLELRGGSGAALDGAGRSSLLAVSHGVLAVSGVTFENGWVNATDASWYRASAGKAAVAVLAHGSTFTDCVFRGNRGVNGGALLVEGGTHVLRRSRFIDNAGYGGGDGGAHDTGGGGAVMLVRGRLEIQDSEFDRNVATDPPGTPDQKGHPGHPPKGRPGLGHTGTHHGTHTQQLPFRLSELWVRKEVAQAARS